MSEIVGQAGFSEGDVRLRQFRIRKVEFYYDFPINPLTGNPDRVEMVRYQLPGDQHTSESVYKVDQLKGGMKKQAWFKDPGLPEGHVREKFYEPDPVWAFLEPYYEAFKRNETMQVVGTPLEAWPGLTHDQMRGFKAAGLFTVEDVCGISDGQFSRIPLPGIRQIQQKARAYLDSLGDKAKIAAELEGDRATIKAQQEELAALRKMMNDMVASQSEPAAVSEDETPRRGPGRPRKVDPDDVAM